MLKDPQIAIRRARLSDVPAMCGLLEELFSIESDFEPEPEKQKKGLAALVEAIIRRIHADVSLSTNWIPAFAGMTN